MTPALPTRPLRPRRPHAPHRPHPAGINFSDGDEVVPSCHSGGNPPTFGPGFVVDPRRRPDASLVADPRRRPDSAQVVGPRRRPDAALDVQFRTTPWR